jgi:AcrR family transcriptional regulator
MPAAKSTARRRKTQEERSVAMRARLQKATLKCLRQYGYANTTISRIVATAGVSRGAHVHHFPSKALLFEQAAEDLLRQAYADLGKAVLAVSAADDRLSTMVTGAWEKLFKGPSNEVFVELLVASRADRELKRCLHPLALEYVMTLRQAAEHYLEPLGAINAPDLMMLTQWLFRGMALDMAIAEQPGYFDRFVALWISMLRDQARARDGVADKPPRPEHWDGVIAESAAPAPRARRQRAPSKPLAKSKSPSTT